MEVTRIRLHYDSGSNSLSNRCYVTFQGCDAANAAYEAVSFLSNGGNTLTATFVRSSNVVDSECEYLPNIFEDATDEVPNVRLVLTPSWFVAYYKNWHGNFIHAYKYLQPEIGVIPEGNIKKYGRGILMRAKHLTQAIKCFYTRHAQWIPC